MYLKIGCISTVVVSSPEIAKDVLLKYDRVFSSRRVPCAAMSNEHNKYSMVWLPAKNQWRQLRRICKEQMFSMPLLDASWDLRLEKLQKLGDYVNQCCINGRAVKIDFFPLLKYFDPQGISRRTKFYLEKFFAIFDGIIDQRMQTRGTTVKNDILEALLDLNQKPEPELSRDDIKHLLLDLFVAGTDTTSKGHSSQGISYQIVSFFSKLKSTFILHDKPMEIIMG
ncbi:unnamed protein product [Fraxinus pennsylvanica]|uniref:Cytochrome P450 n=1 Tax=Fraxinus pennsylvanica TaxID=56036 RepID=A0AAD1ZCA2_9LAMI|nr:unnamed protein product [Fraxinus pennsylvanica]